MKLNAAQQAAAQAPESAVLVLAGPGTGKTTMLVARALWLAERYERVRIATFSRRGVRVVVARLDVLNLKPELRARIEVTTHHGLATQLLRRHGQLIGWSSGWSVIDRAEQESLERESQQGDLFAARMQRAELRTYDELLPAAVDLLTHCAGIAEQESAGTALLVDEAHDSCAEEWAIDQALGRESLTVVGDPAQRIYGWRGAQGIEDLPSKLWATYELADNYRSGPAILDLANRLHIPGRVDLRAHRTEGRVQWWQAPTDEQLIERLLQDDDLLLQPERWAILARTRRRLEMVERWLTSAGVPVRAPGLAAKRWETPEARRLIDHLHCVANPHDSLHLGRVLRQAGWSEGQLLDAEFGRSSPSRPLSLWEWVVEHADAGSRAAEALRTIASLRSISAADEDDIGLDAYDCAEVLQQRGVDVGGPGGSMRGRTVAEWLHWLADPDRDDPSDEDEAVYLGTIHSAKGEEFGSVVLLGLEEGYLPGPRWSTERRPEPDRIAEERRLLYVAITRAQERLIIARRTEKTVRGGKIVPAKPSRFVAELRSES